MLRAAYSHPVAVQHANSGAARIADARGRAARLVNRVPHREAARTWLVDYYLEGWAEADPVKILEAAAPDYRFDDPLVGIFSRQSLPRYFDCLQTRFAFGAAATKRSDMAFFLRGPMDAPSLRGQLQFWREAPRIGLTGITQIEVGERGVIAERTAYDLNLASDLLCRAGSGICQQQTHGR